MTCVALGAARTFHRILDGRATVMDGNSVCQPDASSGSLVTNMFMSDDGDRALHQLRFLIALRRLPLKSFLHGPLVIGDPARPRCHIQSSRYADLRQCREVMGGGDAASTEDDDLSILTHTEPCEVALQGSRVGEVIVVGEVRRCRGADRSGDVAGNAAVEQITKRQRSRSFASRGVARIWSAQLAKARSRLARQAGGSLLPTVISQRARLRCDFGCTAISCWSG